ASPLEEQRNLSTPMDGESRMATTEPPVKDRSPWLAALLALTAGPVSQVYCGRLRRGIGILFLGFLTLFLLIASLLYLPWDHAGVFSAALIFLCWWLGVAVDAVA